MESRFRKLISAKRDKTKSQVIETDLPSTSDGAGSSQWSLTTLMPQPLFKLHNDSKSILEQDESGVQAIPYDAVIAGKAPTFSSGFVQGNGPVKIQTSRRLSSGEVEATVPDMRRILDDIREGDCIVGRKDLHSQSTKGVRPQITSIWSNRQSFAEAFQSPRPAPRTPTSPVSSSSNEHSDDCYPFSRSIQDRPVASSPSVTSFQTQSSQHHTKSPTLRRASQFSSVSSATSPSIHVEEQNATIAALWKAECNRLTETYGRDYVERNVHSPNIGSAQTSMWSAPYKTSVKVSEVELEPLPHPSTGNIEKIDSSTRRLSRVSATSTSNDDSSDSTSNKRASQVSSSAGSSAYTAQTSLTDHDAVVTRDEIRKIINEMRSTYLRALDTHAPSSPKLGPTTKRKQRSKLATNSRRAPVKPSTVTDRQTWHGNATEAQKDGYKMRSASNPNATFGRLSPVEASPPPRSPKRPTHHLQRADSTTLGNMMAKISNGNGSNEAAPDLKTEDEPAPPTPSRNPNRLLRPELRPAIKPIGNFF